MGFEIGSHEREKKFRFCDYCYQGYNNFLKLKSNPLNKASTENFSHFTNYLLKEKEDITNIKHRVFFNEPTNIPFLQEKHNEIVNKNNEELITFIFKKYNIYEKWYKLLVNLIENAVKNVRFRGDCMDINNYVKIKKIPYEDESLTKYVNGLVCHKNISDKKMKNHFISPKILITTQIELIGNTDLTMFDNLIQNEKKQIKKIIDRIMKLKPNIILIEKSINRIAYEYFKEADIIVLIKIKHNLIKRIARVTKATIIKDLSDLDKLPEDKILGTCDKFYIKKFFIEGYNKKNYNKMNEKFEKFEKNENFIQFDKIETFDQFHKNEKLKEIEYKKEETPNDPNYLFIETNSPFLGSTLIISGPNEEELKTIKYCLKLTLKLVRNFLLEKDLVTTEIILINQINIESEKNDQIVKKSLSFGSFIDQKNIQEDLKHKREGDFSRYLFTKMSFEDIVSKQYIHYTKVCYVRGFLENCNEICGNEEAVKCFYQNFNENKKKRETAIFDYFVEICELPSSIKIKYYSEEDCGLGIFFI